MKFTPVYEKEFTPISIVLRDYKEQVKSEKSKTLKICVERNDSYNYVYSLDIFASPEKREKNYDISERIIKSILWVVGGYKIYISGDEYISENIALILLLYPSGFWEKVSIRITAFFSFRHHFLLIAKII